MNLLTVLATAVPLAAALGVLSYTIRNASKLAPVESSRARRARSISVEDLGRIEGNLPNLVRVLVVADQIEKPDGSLGQAVEANFAKGVDYLFLISASKAATEKSRYYKLFEAYAQIRGANSKSLDIKALPFEWDSYPIIFYQTRDATNALATIAFRGTELREGIASRYERVPTEYAHTVATSLLADAPSDVVVTGFTGREEFESGAFIKVTPITAAKHNR